MSGAIKSVTSVFKKVAKSPIGKIAIGAAVAYFTAGIGTAVLGAVGATGMSATLTTVLSHAISGTIAGGLTSALTGDNIGKGLAFGGIGGAVMGGVQSALGNFSTLPGGEPKPTDAAKIGGDAASQTANAVQTTGTAQAGAIAAQPAVGGEFAPSLSGADAQIAGTGMLQPGAPTIAATAPATAPASGGGIGQWVKDNPTATALVGGGLMQGIGSGLLAKSTADATTESTEAKLAAEREKQAGITASHTGTGLLQPGPLDQTPRPKPADRFNPASYAGNGQWVYDPSAGRIVWKATAAA